MAAINAISFRLTTEQRRNQARARARYLEQRGRIAGAPVYGTRRTTTDGR